MTSTFTIPDFDERIFVEALSHTNNNFYITLDRNSFHSVASKLETTKENLAASSMVKLGNGLKMHICMVDFNIPFSQNGTLVIKKLLKVMKQEGYLFCSGKSYHFYGTSLMTKSDYVEFLLKLIFLSPIVDKNWIVHQLLREQSFLRITKKYGHFPFLIESVG